MNERKKKTNGLRFECPYFLQLLQQVGNFLFTLHMLRLNLTFDDESATTIFAFVIGQFSSLGVSTTFFDLKLSTESFRLRFQSLHLPDNDWGFERR